MANELKVEQQNQKKYLKPALGSQVIFKYTNIVLLLILLFCIQGFIDFRNYAKNKGYHVFSEDSLIWCGIGFFGIFIAKYSYFHLMKNKMDSILKERYIGEERIYKLKSLLKLSFDSIFYAFASTMAYILFKDQYWFPSVVGGAGSCSKIYKQYPNAPVSEMYFMIQFGVHLFSVFQMVVIKRKTERKFYEYLLHHCVAATLILFSMMSNQTAAGAMILIVHDASDVFLAFGRAYLETKVDSILIGAIIYFTQLIIWIFMRILVFPFCLLANVYINTPASNDQWHIISFEYGYLLTMAFVLYGMHIFWTYFMIKIGVQALLTKNKWQNSHEGNKNKQ